MARFINTKYSNEQLVMIEHTFPIECIIESSYIINGYGEYALRVNRLSNDRSSSSVVIRKRFRQFFELNETLRDFGYQIDFPKKKIFGNTNPTFLGQRQKELQIFLNVLFQHVELCKSFLIQKFISQENSIFNYQISALQHVSMFVRSTNNSYEILEPLYDFGWRLEKAYFLAARAGRPREERYLIVWTHYGPEAILNERDILYCLKYLKSISHPSFVPLEDVHANDGGILTVYRFHSQGSLKDFLHQTRPANGIYWKRYGPKNPGRPFDLKFIKSVGRQILESLKFIHENQMFFGHLHSANILIHCESHPTVQLLDLANAVAGLSSKFRSSYVTLRSLYTIEQIDVYAFARLIYELATGEDCPTNQTGNFLLTIPIVVREILEKIFKPNETIPTIKDLLSDPFFQVENVGSRSSMRMNDKVKNLFDQIRQISQEKLESDRKKLKNADRQSKIFEFLKSDEEKSKRRRERQIQKSNEQFDSNSLSIDTSNVSIVENKVIVETPPSSIHETDFLSSIRSFQVSSLKHCRTNDFSASRFN